jgi:predicted transcriptional regulator
MDVTLLNELAQGHGTPDRPDGFGVTQKEYSENTGCTVSQAKYYLEGLVRNGILQSQNMHMVGKSGVHKVYSRKVENA